MEGGSLCQLVLGLTRLGDRGRARDPSFWSCVPQSHTRKADDGGDVLVWDGLPLVGVGWQSGRRSILSRAATWPSVMSICRSRLACLNDEISLSQNETCTNVQVLSHAIHFTFPTIRPFTHSVTGREINSDRITGD